MQSFRSLLHHTRIRNLNWLLQFMLDSNTSFFLPFFIATPMQYRSSQAPALSLCCYRHDGYCYPLCQAGKWAHASTLTWATAIGFLTHCATVELLTRVFIHISLTKWSYVAMHISKRAEIVLLQCINRWECWIFVNNLESYRLA